MKAVRDFIYELVCIRNIHKSKILLLVLLKFLETLGKTLSPGFQLPHWYYQWVKADVLQSKCHFPNSINWGQKVKRPRILKTYFWHTSQTSPGSTQPIPDLSVKEHESQSHWCLTNWLSMTHSLPALAFPLQLNSVAFVHMYSFWLSHVSLSCKHAHVYRY